jgi:hypothetical protein
VRDASVIIPIGKTVSLDLSPDDRPVTSNPPGDLSTRQAGIATAHDLKALTKAQTMTRSART